MGKAGAEGKHVWLEEREQGGGAGDSEYSSAFRLSLSQDRGTQ